MHEVLVFSNKIKNPRLFSRASEAFKFEVAHVSHKLFMKNQFYELPLPISQVNSSLHPILDFVIQPKSSLFGVMTDEKGGIVQEEHIAIFHPEEVTGIGVNSKTSGFMTGGNPARSHIAESFLRDVFCHGLQPLPERDIAHIEETGLNVNYWVMCDARAVIQPGILGSCRRRVLLLIIQKRLEAPNKYLPGHGKKAIMTRREFLLSVALFLFFFLSPAHADKNKGTDAGSLLLPKVVVVTTGGTIAMKYDPASGGVVPAVSGKDLIEAVPGLDKIADVEAMEFCNIDSSQMTPDIWRGLSVKVEEILGRTDVRGVVVTHGTDTMAEGAFFLETTLRSQKPVVFVGAMRSASDLSPDGPANIYNAVVQVCSPQASSWGVTVTMNQYVNSARHVYKDDTTNVQTFDSGGYGYLGYIVGDQVISFNNVVLKKKLPLPQSLPEVDLFTTYAGDDGRFIRYAVDHGAKGLVVEGVGAGNVNKAVFEAILYAIGKKIPVVVASRVRYGGVYPLYGDEGGGSSLVKAGALLAGDLSPYKARLLLMIALAQPDMTPDKLKKLFSIR